MTEELRRIDSFQSIASDFRLGCSQATVVPVYQNSVKVPGESSSGVDFSYLYLLFLLLPCLFLYLCFFLGKKQIGERSVNYLTELFRVGGGNNVNVLTNFMGIVVQVMLNVSEVPMLAAISLIVAADAFTCVNAIYQVTDELINLLESKDTLRRLREVTHFSLTCLLIAYALSDVINVLSIVYYNIIDLRYFAIVFSLFVRMLEIFAVKEAIKERKKWVKANPTPHVVNFTSQEEAAIAVKLAYRSMERVSKSLEEIRGLLTETEESKNVIKNQYDFAQSKYNELEAAELTMDA